MGSWVHESGSEEKDLYFPHACFYAFMVHCVYKQFLELIYECLNFI